MLDIKCAGALIYALDTQRFLFLYRARSKQSDVWGLPGGTVEASETPWIACQREIKEEIGGINFSKIIPLEKYQSKNRAFEYHTYFCLTEREFLPILNEEHSGYVWTSYLKWPRPLHYGVKKTLDRKTNASKIQTIFSTLVVN